MKKEITGSVKVIPLGGLEQIGMNITAIECDDSIVVVDCGLSFPEEEMLGIDLVIPDVTYLKENIDKVKGFVITHGHEDHIGAIPYVIKERRPGDIATCYCDAGKAERELHWKAEKDLKTMCADSWRWQKNNPNGYDD